MHAAAASAPPGIFPTASFTYWANSGSSGAAPPHDGRERLPQVDARIAHPERRRGDDQRPQRGSVAGFVDSHEDGHG